MSQKRVAIVQSCYIPWKGYFDLIDQVDEFIFLDDAQFTRRDWRNRNLIKTAQGTKWLTIPVVSKGQFHARIDQVETQGLAWAKKHWQTLRHSYSKAPFFKTCGPWVESLYEQLDETKLSEINRFFVRELCQFLGIETKLRWSTDYGESESTKTERLLELCAAAGADSYLSGPSARAYLDPSRFAEAGVQLTYADYAGYPEYTGQPHPPFSHHVTVLDLIFSVGESAREYLRRSS